MSESPRMAPTPPSDAGPRERETGKPHRYNPMGVCVRCGLAAFSTGGAACSGLPAAPAAEAPREDGLLPKRKWILAAAERAAALPGAEAGTPEDADVQTIADYLDASCLGHAGCTIPHAALDRIRARLASPSPTGAE